MRVIRGTTLVTFSRRERP